MKILYTIFFAASVFIFVGCGFTNEEILRTQEFSSATKNVGEFSASEFVNIRKDIIKMNEDLIAIDISKSSKDFILDYPLSVEETTIRVAACNTIKLYGELLLMLVSDNNNQNYFLIANSLLDNTSLALNKSFSDDQKSLYSKIFTGIAGLIEENNRADFGREIIPIYEEPINKIADLLMKDFSLQDSLSGYNQAYSVTAKRLKNAASVLVNKGKDYNVLERDRAVQSLVLAEEVLLRSKLLNTNAIELLSRLKAANSELIKVIKHQTYSIDDIKNFAKKMQEINNIQKVLSQNE